MTAPATRLKLMHPPFILPTLKEKPALKQRIFASLAWQLDRLKLQINGCLARLGPRIFIAANWPWPMKRPCQRSRLRLQGCGGGIGDGLMCLPVISEIKRRNPKCHITFSTQHVDFFRNYPDIDETVWDDGKPDSSFTKLRYGLAIPPPRPLMSLMGECVGLIMDFDELTPPPVTQSPGILKAMEGIGRPLVVIQTRSSRWTTNKDWPTEQWRALIGGLVGRFEVVEVGLDPLFSEGEFGDRYRSLAGKTDLADLAYVISQADLFIGPSSGGMHLAHAFKVKSVIIFGGYESPEGYRYPRTRSFYTPVPCAPCWRQDCPYDIKCLRAINPADVFEAVLSLMNEPDSGPSEQPG
jgi:ADP-heptose:LPS heptosyltransferase